MIGWVLPQGLSLEGLVGDCGKDFSTSRVVGSDIAVVVSVVGTMAVSCVFSFIPVPFYVIDSRFNTLRILP